MMAVFRERRQQEINALSATAAMGWTALFNGLAGKDGERAKPQDFLPFSQTETLKKQARLSDKTRSIISHLVDRNKLPPVLTNAFKQLLEN
jgi:hypothetical protein